MWSPYVAVDPGYLRDYCSSFYINGPPFIPIVTCEVCGDRRQSERLTVEVVDVLSRKRMPGLYGTFRNIQWMEQYSDWMEENSDWPTMYICFRCQDYVAIVRS